MYVLYAKAKGWMKRETLAAIAVQSNRKEFRLSNGLPLFMKIQVAATKRELLYRNKNTIFDTLKTTQ